MRSRLARAAFQWSKERRAADGPADDPLREIYKDGICRVNDKLYTKTIQFFDINYQLAQADDKAQIFENYCDFLNYFDSTISVQLTFINQRANMQDFSKSIAIPPQGDEYDDIRREYAECSKISLKKEITALPNGSISPLALRRTTCVPRKCAWSVWKRMY